MTRKSASGHSAESEDGYEVGYGKPPKNTRFKTGQSGNPRGRRRGQRNLRTVVKEVLKETITIREGERTRTISRLDAIVRVTINNALKGDVKAFAAFIQLIRPTGLMDEEAETSSQNVVGTEDNAILAEFLARHGIVEQQDSCGEVFPATKSSSPQPDATTPNRPKTEDKT
jgi:Family of unknown function (DUF5681)